ncbi:tyrosine-type recombinase/integrase [Aminipila sp.]|uniref:tyrosine-type recombinase/integrase n=1 Tax=Aminipila sp. TaxID=2060095 RepID=UPI003FA434F2
MHAKRLSCASWLLYNGEDLKTVQEILRHSKYELTANTYGHVVMKAKTFLKSGIIFRYQSITG